jgi:signal transduction histidine kinase
MSHRVTARRILIVDGSRTAALLVAAHLEEVARYKHAVTHVTSLSAAAAAIRDAPGAPFDAVLLDLTMPGNAGIDTLESALVTLAPLPIVVVSSVEDESFALDAMSCGAEDFLLRSSLDGRTISRAISYAIERHIARLQLDRSLDEQDAVHRELQRLAIIQSEFIAIASHELRTPVAIARGFLDVVVNHGSQLDQGEANDFLERAQRALVRLQTLLDDVLLMCRIGAQGPPAQTESVDLAAAVEEGCRTSIADAADLQVTVPAGLLVQADPLQLARVVRNLIENAIRHGQPPVQVHTVADPQGIDLHVRDAGEGIPSSFHPHLFERFTQADGSASRAEGGTGLGLAIVRGLVEAVGGTITLKPSDIGAHFVLRLQRTSAEADAVRSDRVHTATSPDAG